MVSGLGTSPGRHLQMGLPSLLAVQVVPGPQGLGSQGSRMEHWTSGLGSGTKPSGHLQNGRPSWRQRTINIVAMMMGYLGDAHGVSAARIGVTRIRENTTLGRSGVGYQTLWTLASGLPLLGNTHGPGSTGVGITGVTPGCWLVGG